MGTTRQIIQSNIKRLVDLCGSPKAFADKVGVTKQAVNNWINSSNIPDIEKLASIAHAFDMPLSEILSSEDGLHPIPNTSSMWIDRPLYGSIAAGTPLEMIEIDDSYPAPKAIVDKYPDGFWLKIASNSMDLMFPEGTLVYIDPMDDIRVNNKPYALCVNGYDATVKLTEKLANGYKLTPASTDPTYKPTVYDYAIPGTDKITVIGEVVYDMKPFDWSY